MNDFSLVGLAMRPQLRLFDQYVLRAAGVIGAQCFQGGAVLDGLYVKIGCVCLREAGEEGIAQFRHRGPHFHGEP